MNILVVSRSPWKKNNSFGNTYDNIFGKMQNIRIANIYLADGMPDSENANVSDYFRISEKKILKSIFKRRNKTEKIGEIIIPASDSDNHITEDSYGKVFDSMRKNRWSGFFIAREFLWILGQINYEKLDEFVTEFKPDIIFLPFYYAIYVDRIAIHLKKKFDIPMVLEASIDIYSLKQLSFDPVYWLNRFWIRKYIRKTVEISEKLYVISEKMRKDYRKMLEIDCGILYKFPDSSRKLEQYEYTGEKVQFLYTGNIGAGRWKSLGLIGKALYESNKGELTIYTPTVLTAKMKAALKYCTLKAPVSPQEVLRLQNRADVLVHAEALDTKNRLEVRYSISTKVMDYISAERCIFAVGPKNIASIEFLEENELALTAYNERMISAAVQRIISDTDILEEYPQKCHKYIEKIHLSKPQQEILYEDLRDIIIRYNSTKTGANNHD